jgi:hypothetical protein
LGVSRKYIYYVLFDLDLYKDKKSKIMYYNNANGGKYGKKVKEKIIKKK